MLFRWPWIAALLLAACAQVREPSGGPEDKIGPTLTESAPPQRSVGFTGDRIVLRFNERIQLKSMRENLVVSPPLAAAPSVRLLGDRSVQIGLEAPLLPNTTYVFDYAKGVADLTQGNPAQSGPFVLSTGAVIDSAEIGVAVLEARTGVAADVLEVLVFAGDDTCDPRACLPAYFARTDEHGRARVRYMRPGRYHAFALRDKNGNHRYDLPNEAIAFGDSTVTASADSNATPVELVLFTALDSAQRALNARIVDGALRIALSRPAKKVELTALSGKRDTSWIPEWTSGRDTVRLWFTGADSVSDRSVLIRVDTVPIDTVSLELRKPRKPLGLVQAPLSGTLTLEVEASRLLAFIDTARMSLFKDSLTIPFMLSTSPMHARRFEVRSALKQGDRATLKLLPGALTDHQQRTNDTLSLELVVPNDNETGNLSIRLPALDSLHHSAYLLELLDPGGRVLLTQAGDSLPAQVKWQALPPKAYGLRLVADRNGNGRWDTGDLSRKLQPERVFMHRKGAIVRAGWDVDVVWE